MSSEIPDSDDEYLDNELRKSISSTIYATLCEDDKRGGNLAATPRMTFSPAESLDSSLTLVSGAVTTVGAVDREQEQQQFGTRTSIF